MNKSVALAGVGMLLAGWLLHGRTSDVPPPVLPLGVGVNIHFNRGHERHLDLIAAAGIRVVRMDLGWAGIERRRGEYDWSAYDELTANLEARGLQPLYILDYSNPLYEEEVITRNPITGREQRATASPRHPESVAAFARWAAAAAARYRERRVMWEIWNEPNIHFWKPHPDVEEYNALALATCRAMRAAAPDATIIGPATSGFPWDFLGKHFASGILEHLDGVSVHPYRSYDRSPETAAPDYGKLRKLIGRHAPAAKRDLPILSGEWGYATHERGVSLETQAAYAARQQLANLLAGVRVSVWYDWQNDGPDPAEREHNFGLVNTDLSPKPAYRAIRTLTGALRGCRIVRRLAGQGDADYILLLEDETGGQRLAVWTLGEAHEVAIDVEKVGGAAPRGWRGLGGTFVPRLEDGHLHLELGSLPCYVTLNGWKVGGPGRSAER